MRPGPVSPQARSPSAGPITWIPSDRKVAMFRRVAGCAHISTFIAGATTTGLSVASRAVVARSVASPPRHLGENVRRRRHDDDEVRLARQADVAHFRLVGEREQIRVDLLAGERGHRERRDELRPALREDAPDPVSAIP